jgi:hypothetical protein
MYCYMNERLPNSWGLITVAETSAVRATFLQRLIVVG